MVPERRGQAGPSLDLRHLLPEGETSHFVSQLLYFFWIGRLPKAFRQGKESLLLFLPLCEAGSTNSTSTRLSLRRFFLAMRSTCSASRAGRVTLLRICFAAGHDTGVHHFGAGWCQTAVQGQEECWRIASGGEELTLQLTQSRNLYHAPANGRNQGLPL